MSDRHKYRIYSESYNDYLNEESLANMRLAPDGQLYSIGGTIVLGGTIEMCIGLKEKKKVLMHVGDKIKLPSGNMCEIVAGNYKTLTDSWGVDHYTTGFALKFDDDSGYTDFGGHADFEKVGTIHDETLKRCNEVRK